MKRLRTATILGLAALATLFVGCKTTDKPPCCTPKQTCISEIETRANTFTYNRQTNPTLAANSRGELLVTWGSRRQEKGTYGVFAQRFDALGRRLGTEVHVNQTVRGMQSEPAVAFDTDQSAWIVWQSDTRDGDHCAIMARRFATTDYGDLTPITDEFQINQTAAGNQFNPTIASDCAGKVFVVWTSDDIGRTLVMGRMFSADTAPLTDEFRLGTAAAGRESTPAIASQGEHGFVATWARTDADNRPGDLLVRRFTAGGIPYATEFAVNSPGTGSQIEPSVDTAGDGSFVVSWMTRHANRYAVAYRVFSADATPRGPLQIAADGPQWLSGAAVAVAPDGRFVISHNVNTPASADMTVVKPAHRSTPSEIIAQRFDRDGNLLGHSFRVNQFNVGRQAQTIAASGRQSIWTAQEQLAFVWTGDTGQDDKRGVGLSLLVPDTLAVPAPPSVAQLPAAASISAADVYPLIPPVYDPDFVPEPRDANVVPRGPDFGFLGIQATGWTPPDPDLAAGPDHVVLVVNGGIAFFDQTGNQTFFQSIAGGGGFWGEVGATSFVFDPVALYDIDSARFIVAAAEHADNGDMAIVLAVSDDANPNGTWHKYRFVVSSYGDFIDFPNLGVDGDAIYINVDFFDTPTGNWIFIIPKAPTLVGDPVSLTGVQTSTGVRSLGNVKTYDADAPAQYFATAFSGSNTHIDIDAVVNPLTSPTRYTYSLSVPYFSQPPDAEQLGTSNLADTIDIRIKNGVYRNGSLWLVHTIGENNTARVRWYEVVTNGWPISGQNPTLRQSGTLNYGTGQHNWMSDINVDDEGNAIICMSRSSASDYIAAARAIRAASDPLGTFRDPVTLQESTSPETGSRWGDYAGVDEEPDHPGVFWTHNEYRTSAWRTWVGQVIMPTFFDDLRVSLPDGAPTVLAPNEPTSFDVEIHLGDDTLVADSALLHYRYDDGVFQEIPLVYDTGEIYTATLPPAACADTPEFYVSAEGDVTGLVNSPDSGTYSAAVGILTIAFADDFETDQGWTVSGNAADGMWDRGVPVGGGDRGDPSTDYDGSGQCYLTDNVDDNSDVDDGYTYLDSPIIDLSTGDADIRFALWYTNNFGGDPNNDLFKVYVSDNNGSTWTLVETIGPDTSGGWTLHTFTVGDFVTPTNQVRVRLEASDLNEGSVVEAGVDAFEVISFSCEDEICLGDLDGDDDIDLADLAQLLGSYGTTGGAEYEDGDLDGDGDVDLSDLAALLGVYGDTCP